MIDLSSLSLRSYLRAFAAVFCLTPCLIMAVFLSFFLSERLHRLYTDQIRQTLVLQKNQLDMWLSYRQREVLRLSRLHELVEGNLAAAERSFRRFVSVMPEFRGLGFIDITGHTVIDTIASPGIYLGDRAYFQAGREGKSFVSDLIVGRATGMRLIMFSAPVTDSAGAFKGVLFAPVHLDILSQTLSKVSLDFGGTVVLLDRSGNVIASQAPPGGSALTVHPATASLSARSEAGAVFSYQAPDGERMMAVAAELDLNGWTLVGSVSEQGLEKAVRPVIWAVLGAGLLALAAVAPLAARAARSLERVVTPLARHAQAVTQGDYKTPPPDMDASPAPAEIALLGRAYMAMHGRLAEHMSLLETQALTDPLTGLPNRRCLMEEGPRLMEVSLRQHNPCACLLLDLDHFKVINDHFGHAKGDAVLQQVAACLRAHVRAADLLGRLGGEEFLLVCANTGLEEARTLADRMRAAIPAEVPAPEGGRAVTVSIGVAVAGGGTMPGCDRFERLLVGADKAMYLAKNQGRDSVAVLDCDATRDSCPLEDG